MTPREHAIELVDKYKPFVYCYRGSGMLSNTYDEDVALHMAKQCALIAVLEILYVLNEMDDTLSYNSSIFYNEVKNEIEKL